jgi:hypothetical protein
MRLLSYVLRAELHARKLLFAVKAVERPGGRTGGLEKVGL